MLDADLMLSGTVMTPFLIAVEPLEADTGYEPVTVDVMPCPPLRYDEDTLLCAPVAVEMLLPEEMPATDVLVPPVLRTAVIPEAEVFLVATLPLAVLVLTLPDADVEDPLLTDEVPDTVADDAFLDVYVLLTLEPDDVRCP